jgi:putative membrane protein
MNQPMKTILRRIFISSFALFIMPLLIPGMNVAGGFWMLLLGGIVLAGLFLILKPILNILTFPVNAMTMGLFSVFNSALILYLLTVFVGSITIEPFMYPRTDLLGVIIPKLTFNTFLAFIYTAFVLSFIDSFLSWIMS